MLQVHDETQICRSGVDHGANPVDKRLEEVHCAHSTCIHPVLPRAEAPALPTHLAAVPPVTRSCGPRCTPARSGPGERDELLVDVVTRRRAGSCVYWFARSVVYQTVCV